jgi:hypothetical protein
MTTDRRSMPSRDPQAGLDDLLREFYAAEMPAELCGSAVDRPVAASVAITRRPARSSPGRRFSLTAMLATLLLAASAFVLMPHVVSRTSRTGADAVSGESRADQTDIAAEPPAGSGRGPVELQGAPDSSVPASTAPANGADDQFPEFDIRILPIDGDRR